MARQAVKPHRQEREVNRPQRRKSVRLSGTLHRPVGETLGTRDAQRSKSAKTKQTVSVAEVFMKKPTVNPRDKKHHRRIEAREPTPEPNLLSNFRGTRVEPAPDLRVLSDCDPDAVELTRGALTTNAKAGFDDIHAMFADRLMASKKTDGSFAREIGKDTAKLTAPLLHEKIETTTTRDGKRNTEVVEIGKRVATFKKFIEKEEGRLKETWKLWDEVQNEYSELGVEVFGPEVFGNDAAGLKLRQKGFKREIELLDLEQNARVEEFNEEIEDTGTRILQKMKASEKVRNISH